MPSEGSTMPDRGSTWRDWGGGRDDGGARLLAVISIAHLTCAVVGMIVAIRRGHAYDVGLMRGVPDNVRRDAFLRGTALSPPITMMATQVALTATVATQGHRRAAKGLRMLAALMVSGYLSERLVRERLLPRGWEPSETPLAALSLGLSAAMALVPSSGPPARVPASCGPSQPVNGPR